MTHVKVCGLTRLDDALAAAEAGADLLGFVLVATSPRYLPPERVAELIRGLRARGVTVPCVGVVAGRPLPELLGLRARLGLTYLQLHGEEGPELAAALYPGVIVARRVTGPASLAGLRAYTAYAYLLDARGVERRSEAGQVWDWRLLRRADLDGRIIVAGGLTPGNVAEAVRVARPWGVDVASGVEASPGRKDPAAVARFIEQVREVDRECTDDGSREFVA